MIYHQFAHPPVDPCFSSKLHSTRKKTISNLQYIPHNLTASTSQPCYSTDHDHHQSHSTKKIVNITCITSCSGFIRTHSVKRQQLQAFRKYQLPGWWCSCTELPIRMQNMHTLTRHTISLLSNWRRQYILGSWNSSWAKWLVYIPPQNMQITMMSTHYR